MHGFDNYFAGKIPVASFLTSIPFGMDRPDQWETWFYEYGGIEFAREAYAGFNMMWVGNLQHDDNLIHSKIPIRSFEEFKGKKIRFGGGLIADLFKEAGVSTILLPGGEVYPALEKGVIDAADFVGAAINYNLGYGEIAKYIIMGPPTTPCIHQPVDMMSFVVNMKSWQKLPKHLQLLLTAAVREHSWTQYTAIQKADNEAYDKFKKQGVEIVRLKESDVAKFKKYAPSVWVRWAKKHPLALKAFKSQWEFLKSEKVKYYTDADLVDPSGKRITL
jgi:TRAP-type mannitol/chloroaromatic compound transport system substrate-binding protein